MLLQHERELVIERCRMLSTLGLTRGTGGNISALDREKGFFAISPSGMDYFAMEAGDVVVLDLDGHRVDGERTPSTESDMHRLLYIDREEINAVVHTHSTFAATLACLHRELPAVHYRIGWSGGENVRCISYAPFGSPELAAAARDGMRGRFAVLLGNHGLLAAGPDMTYAFNVAEEIEFVCELYLRASYAGRPSLLSAEEMGVVLEKFTTYGQRA